MPLGVASPLKIKLSQDPQGNLYVDGFAGGLNTLVSPQHIQDNECSILQNAQISEDGVISRRGGSAQYDKNGVADSTRVFGLFPFTTYNSSNVATRFLLKVDASGNLKKLNTDGTWTTITGFTYTTGLNTEFAQSATNAYICNGTDPLSKTDGSTITVFSNVTNPVGGLTVVQQGTAGTSGYQYSYTLVTNTGETLPCAAVAITNGNAILSATNNNLLTITRSSDANVTGYNIYGRINNSMYYLGFVTQTASGNPTFTDDGSKTPNTFFSQPVQNSTGGIIGTSCITYHDALLVFGIKGDPSRVYYTAGLDKFESFQLIDGGGSVVCNREDGDVVVGGVSFKDKVIILKNRSSYMFQFNTSSIASLTVVNPLIGACAQRSIKVVLNDVYFLSPAGSIFTLGYQQGYYGAGGVADLLRTNEVSIKIHPTLQGINTANLSKAAAIYSVPNYKYILAYADGGSTYNNKLAVLDTRYSAWAIWDNMSPNCFCNYVDTTNTEHVLYGDDNAGKVIEMFKGTSDQGNTFAFKMRTKDFNVGAFHLIKTWIWPTFHFRNILGTVKTTVITDGATNVSSVNIGSTTSFTGFSYDKLGTQKFGTTSGSSASATSADAPRQKNLRVDGRSIMFLFENTSTADSFTLLGVQSRYITRVGRRLGSSFIVS